MMHMNDDKKNILFILSETRISQTEKAGGMYRYINKAHVRWNILLSDCYKAFTSADARRAIAQGLDGVIVSMPRTTEAVRSFCASGIPVVQIEQTPIDNRRCLTVLNDEKNIGALAAREFARITDRDTRCLVGAGNLAWSALREKGFCEDVANRGKRIYSFKQNSEAALSRWIAALPKPCAIFAADDRLSYNILSIARSLDLKIPKDIALLSVSSNDVFCDNCRPTLSRIQPDYERMGYEAAEALDRFLRVGTFPGTTITIQPKGIVRCASIPGRRTGDTIAARTLEYIRQNLSHPITVDDIACNLGVSRRLLFLRFKEAGAGTVLQQITAIRLEETKKRLAKSSDSIALVCSQCGWKSENHPKKLFKARYGMSMKEWRDSLAPDAQTGIRGS